jgi:S-DNA-T family DNA segregation ATPase FtsK/SpoIIIE
MASAENHKTTSHSVPSEISPLRWAIGLVFMVVGCYALVAVIFYYFCWRNDYSELIHANVENPLADHVIDNPCGRFGAWLAEWFVGRSFGAFGIIIPYIFISMGLRILRRRAIFCNHSMLSSMLVLILGSLTLGVVFGTRWSMFNTGWGGAIGVQMSILLRDAIGLAGCSLLLVAGWIFTGVFINHNFIKAVNHVGSVIADGSGRLVDSVTSGAKSVIKTQSGREDVVSTGEDEEPEPETPEDESPQTPSIAPISTVASPRREVASRTEEPVTLVSGGVETVNDYYKRNPVRNGDDVISTVTPISGETTTDTPQSVTPSDSTDNLFEEIYTTDTDSRPSESETPTDDASDVSQTTTCPADNDPFIVEPMPPHDPVVSEGLVVTVEEHNDPLVGEQQISTEAYDPLKDLINYHRPSVDLLEDRAPECKVTDEEIYENKVRIEETLKNFGIPIQRIKATTGPTVTLYEIVQGQGVKISKIQGLQQDIAQSLEALGIRIIAPIPGKGTIGIEVPNRNKETVSMYSAIRSRRFQESKAELPVVLGRTIQNENFVFDLTKMPHLLVAGATGQGKSVGLNAIISSLLYRKHPAQLKFVLIDPKQVEFSLYARLERHFLAKMESEDEAIVTDAKKAVYTLNALCVEMENRLTLCKDAGTRNIKEYNEKFMARRLNPNKGHRYMPYIVVIVDEFADLIMTAKEVEAPVMRLAQKARAIGIHLIIATQRPDVRVITGGIKANFPARIAFRVMQMIDSRTIIDRPGAEQLIGRGDMLFSNGGELTRIQCAFVDTPEVERITKYISKQQGYTSAYNLPDYAPDTQQAEGDSSDDVFSESGSAVRYDAKFADIARDAVTMGKISVSMIQRNYEVGFNRAGRIILQLERAGIIGHANGAKPRDILYHDLPSLEAKLQDLGLF